MTLQLKLRMGKFSLLYADIADMEYNDFMREARSSFLHWQSFRRSLEIGLQMTTSTVQLLKKWLLLYEVITSIVIGYCNMSRFTSLSGNGSEARKTVEAKELVFLKVLVKGFSGYISLFIIEFLHILCRHLCSNFQLFAYTTICHVVVQKCQCTTTQLISCEKL